MELHDLLAGVGVLLGLVGIVLVFLPGLLVQLASIAVWALVENNPIGWLVLAVCLAVMIITTALKYQRPGRRLKESGVSRGNLILAVLVAVIGLFVIPVIGAPVGFVATIYVLALFRVGPNKAWPATKAAIKAALHSTGIELAGGSLIALIWVVGALV